MVSETFFHRIPGKNGGATDFTAGSLAISAESSATVNGIRVIGTEEGKCSLGPSHWVLINACVNLLVSHDDAGVPSSHRNRICFLGCLGEYLLII